MENKIIRAYYGQGKGKTSAALGQALRDLQKGQRLTVIQFLKGKWTENTYALSLLEPDVQFFSFDKAEVAFKELTFEEQEQEKQNIRNGFNFAKKVIETGESDLIILDEILGVIDLGIIDEKEVIELINTPNGYKKMYVTGNSCPEKLVSYIDVVSEMKMIKDDTE